MSGSETIKQLYRLFSERDLEGIRAIFHPEIEWYQMKGFPGGGTYIGPDAVFTNVFGKFSNDWQGWKAVVTNFHECGNEVFAEGYYEGTYNATQVYVRAAFIHHYSVENGRVRKFTQYTDTQLIALAMQSPALA